MDPIQFAGGLWNLYGYVLNNPINGLILADSEPPEIERVLVSQFLRLALSRVLSFMWYLQTQVVTLISR